MPKNALKQESKRRAEALERARASEHRLVRFMETAAMVSHEHES